MNRFAPKLSEKVDKVSMFITIAFQAIFIFIASTFIFDIIHFLLHKLAKSQNPILAKLGNLHKYHHQFFDEKLQTHQDLWEMNLKYHLIPEFVTQMIVTLSFLFWFIPLAVLVVILFEVFIFIYVVRKKGFDFNHTYNKRAARRPRMNFFIFPNYHWEHHRDPDNYYGSWYRIFDILFGYCSSLNKKTYLITGANGAFGNEIKKRLQRDGMNFLEVKYGKDFSRKDFQGFIQNAKNADTLILCHGSKQDCQWSLVESYQNLIALFLENTTAELPEIWAIGSEIELHPALLKKDKPYEVAKRDFAKYAATLYQREDILYRHLVPSAFKSSFGPAPFGASWMVWLAFFLAKRGFRYIPLTYTGIALLNYFKFRRL